MMQVSIPICLIRTPQEHSGDMVQQETTMNKDTLLPLIHAGRSRWESALAQLTPEQMTAPALFDGWSVKDLVAHIGAGLDR